MALCVEGQSLCHCHRSFIIDFTEDQQLMSVYIYILMTYRNGKDQLKAIWPMMTKNDWSRDMDIEKVELVKNNLNIWW